MASSEEEKNELCDFYKKRDEFTSKVSSFIDDLEEVSGYSVKAMAAEDICFEAINFGSLNSYEAVGILECVKRRYLDIVEEIYHEENCNEDCCFEEEEEELIVH